MTSKMFKGIGKEVNLRSSATAIEACGLDWEVYKGNVYHNRTIIEDNNKINILAECPNFAGVFREDTNFNLGMVGSNYSIVQNKEAASIVDDILEQETNLKIIGGGEIFNGDKLFLNLQLGDPILLGTEYFKRIIMVAWAHNGGLAVTGRFFLVRVSTNSILSVDSPDIKTSTKIRHSGSVKEKINIAKNIMKDAYKFFENVESKLETLSITPMTDGDFQGLLSKIFPDSESQKGQTRSENKRQDVFGIYKVGKDAESSKGTKFGGLLALTEYCNNDKSTRVTEGKNKDEVELNGILFSNRNKEINIAFKTMLENISV